MLAGEEAGAREQEGEEGGAGQPQQAPEARRALANIPATQMCTGPLHATLFTSTCLGSMSSAYRGYTK